jgi:hypothetical protein
LGAWVQAQRLGWEQLLPAQQWMLENMLQLSPVQASKRPPSAAAPASGLELLTDQGQSVWR